jgi:hypothetical protein
LQKQNDFKSFAVNRSESEKDQSPEQRSFRNFVAVFEQRFATAIVRADPTAPINLVEEPIHNHEQHDDGEKSGRRLQIECAHVVAERTDNSDSDEPGDQSRAKRDTRAGRDRLSVRAFRAGHAGGDRRQHEDAFESFTKNKNTDIEKRDRRTRVRLGRIRRAMRRDSLPHDHRDDPDRSHENTDPKNDTPQPIDLAQSSRTHIPRLPHC